MLMEKNKTSPAELCPTCGTRLSEGATKCLVCGTELTQTGKEKGRVPKTVQGSRMPEITLSLPIALGLLALFLGIGAGIVFLVVRQQPTIAVPPTPTTTPTITPSPSITPTPITPTATNTPLPSPTPLSYAVKEGDTCLSIAFAFDVSVQSIVLLNNLAANCDLFVNQSLLIPHPTATPTPFPTATLSEGEATEQACERIAYSVQENDTLSTISANYQVPIEAIKEYNGLVADTVFSGQNLVIPLCQRIPTPGPTPTPTLPPPYPAPNLLLPPDGEPFDLADDAVTLQWASVGSLRENEAYIVTVEDITSGEGRKLVEYVVDTKFIVPSSFRTRSDIPHVFRWTIGTVRQISTDEEGLPVYESAGAVSNARVFTWQGISPGPSPTP